MPGTEHNVSAALQRELRKRGMDEVPAVEAARWLDELGLLPDSKARPGLPLRELLRAGRIEGGEQRPPRKNGKWFVIRTGASSVAPRPQRPRRSAVPPGRTPESSATVSDCSLEASQAVAALSPDAPPAGSIGELPAAPGLYSLSLLGKRAAKALGLRDVPELVRLDQRVLYIGKAEDCVQARVEKHLEPGGTGHSTLRRSLAALLRLSAVPRPTRIPRPTRKQLMVMTANFALTKESDARLSQWMEENLEIRGHASNYDPLRSLERDVARILQPPLDQDNLWEPNPWAAEVRAARARVRDELRAELGT